MDAIFGDNSGGDIDYDKCQCDRHDSNKYHNTREQKHNKLTC